MGRCIVMLKTTNIIACLAFQHVFSMFTKVLGVIVICTILLIMKLKVINFQNNTCNYEYKIALKDAKNCCHSDRKFNCFCYNLYNYSLRFSR